MILHLPSQRPLVLLKQYRRNYNKLILGVSQVIPKFKITMMHCNQNKNENTVNVQKIKVTKTFIHFRDGKNYVMASSRDISLILNWNLQK